MDGRLRRGAEVGRAVYREARAEDLTFMAGSIAYHAFVSFVPFLVLLFLLVSMAGEEELAAELVALTGPYLSAATRETLTAALRDAASSTGLSLLGLATLLWGTMKIFRSLDTAFSNIYESAGENSLLDQFVDGTAAFVSVGLAVLVAVVVDGLLDPGVVPFAGEVKTLALVVGLSVTFFPMYYLFPDEDVTAREVLPGVAFAAVGWTVLEYLFGIYTDLSSQAETYGFIGAVLVIITWFYFSGFVLLVGAALNAVLAGRTEDVGPVHWELDRGPDDVDWAALSAALATVEEHGADADELALALDDRTVRFPRPAAVRTAETSATRPEELGGWTGSAELTVTWDAETLASALDGVGERVEDVGDRIGDVRGNVEDVDDRVAGVDEPVGTPQDRPGDGDGVGTSE